MIGVEDRDAAAQRDVRVLHVQRGGADAAIGEDRLRLDVDGGGVRRRGAVAVAVLGADRHVVAAVRRQVRHARRAPTPSCGVPDTSVKPVTATVAGSAPRSSVRSAGGHLGDRRIGGDGDRRGAGVGKDRGRVPNTGAPVPSARLCSGRASGDRRANRTRSDRRGSDRQRSDRQRSGCPTVHRWVGWTGTGCPKECRTRRWWASPVDVGSPSDSWSRWPPGPAGRTTVGPVRQRRRGEERGAQCGGHGRRHQRACSHCCGSPHGNGAAPLPDIRRPAAFFLYGCCEHHATHRTLAPAPNREQRGLRNDRWPQLRLPVSAVRILPQSGSPVSGRPDGDRSCPVGRCVRYVVGIVLARPDWQRPGVPGCPGSVRDEPNI